MLFSRLRCHFCGAKSQHNKSTIEFQCPNCEAFNFFDGKGNVVDTPTSRITQPFAADSRPLTFTRALPESLDHQQNEAFCRTCAQNQHLYNETLANYLPDESHPEYKKYEAAIPSYKAELEKRYPMVCRKCAPIAQTKINRADYYGMSQNAATIAAKTKERGGLPPIRTRDDWGKKSMRAFLRLVRIVLYIGMLAQIAFHAYGILNTLFGHATTEPEFADIDGDFEIVFVSSLGECARQALQLQFSNSCYHYFGSLVPVSLAIATAGLFYNPGLIQWYHHTNRIETVTGQGNYFSMQVILLVLRSWSWYQLSNPQFTAQLDSDKLIGFHSATIFFMFLVQAVANRGIASVLWKMKGKIMPKPTDQDVLGAFAGPEIEHYTPRASENDPWRHLRKDDAPFDISSLAKPTTKRPTSSRSAKNFVQQPSPELSGEESDPDAMETDYAPVMRSSQRLFDTRPNLRPRHSQQNAMAFGGMTEQVFDMQHQQRQEQARLQAEQSQKLRYEPPPANNSPFQGKLPPAPMSMERRLRNPVVAPIDPARGPLSQQKDFMAQMSKGIKPLQFPDKRSSFEMKQSTWHLPQDVKELGLEDRFSNTFSLADPSPSGEAKKGGFFGGFFGL